MATKPKSEQLRTANMPALGKQVAAPRRREAREPEQRVSRPEREPTTYRFDLADIKRIVIERDPLSFTIVVYPPRPHPGQSGRS